MLKRYRLVIVNAVLLMALSGSLYGKRIETVTIKKTGFLSGLALPYRDWTFQNQALSDREIELLEPDDQVIRLYTDPSKSQQIQLSVIAGHRKKTVHTPGYCMVGSGWETITAQNGTIEVDGRQMPMSRSIMSNDKGQGLIVTYFFTDGTYSTPSLTRFQLKQLMKRFGSDIPLGALVRILTPIGGMQARAAETLTADFAAQVLPGVLKTLRETKLEVQ